MTSCVCPGGGVITRACPVHDPLSDDQREVLRRHGYEPDLPPRGRAGPPEVIQFLHGPAMRNHVCELDGIEVDGHGGSDLDPGSTACIYCDYEGPNP